MKSLSLMALMAVVAVEQLLVVPFVFSVYFVTNVVMIVEQSLLHFDSPLFVLLHLA